MKNKKRISFILTLILCIQFTQYVSADTWKNNDGSYVKGSGIYTAWYANPGKETISTPTQLIKFKKGASSIISGAGIQPEAWLFRTKKVDLRNSQFSVTYYTPIEDKTVERPFVGTILNNGHYDMVENKYVSTGFDNYQSYSVNPNYYGDQVKFAPTMRYLLNNNATLVEWRYLGYTSTGRAITNPWMIADVPLNSNPTPQTYPMEAQPWGKHINIPKSSFDTVGTTDNAKKRRAIDKLNSYLGKNTYVGFTDYMNYLSLQSDPTYDTPIFLAKHSGDNYYADVIGPSLQEVLNDMTIQSITIKDKRTNEIMGTASRNGKTVIQGSNKKDLINGNVYTVEIVVKNLSSQSTVSKQTVINTGISKDSTANTAPDLTNIESANSTISPNSTITIKYEIKADASYQETIYADLNGIHHANKENNDITNDMIYVSFKVTKNTNTNNLATTDVKILKKSGNIFYEVDNIEPQEKYYLKYEGKYNGNDVYDYGLSYISETVTYVDNNGNIKTETIQKEVYTPQIKEITLKASGAIQFDIPQNSSATEPQTLTAIDEETQTEKIKLKNGSKFYFISKEYTFIYPNFTTKLATLKDSEITGEWSKDYADIYDVRVENVQIIPSGEQKINLNNVGGLNYTVKYDIYYDVPEHMKNKDTYSELLTVSFTDGTTEHILVKPGANTSFTKELTSTQDPPDITGYSYKIDSGIVINADDNVYEYSTIANVEENNKNNTIETNKGLLVSPFNASKVTRANSANTFNQKVRVNNVSIENISLNLVNSNVLDKKYICNKTSEISVEATEELKIVDVYFKSRLTEIKKMGPNRDGWVNLSTDQGLIQAGYGFDIKFNTKYNANFPYGLARNIIVNSTKNSDWNDYTNIRTAEPNIQPEAIVYFNNKKYTVTGYNNTLKALKYTVVSNSLFEKEYQFTLKPDANGNSKKLYVDPKTKDGIMRITIQTATTSGWANSIFSKSLLTDQKTFEIKIDGSYTDDIYDHIDQ